MTEESKPKLILESDKSEINLEKIAKLYSAMLRQNFVECPNCREINSKDAIYCSNCGVRLRHPEHIYVLSSWIIEIVTNPEFLKGLIYSERDTKVNGIAVDFFIEKEGEYILVFSYGSSAFKNLLAEGGDKLRKIHGKPVRVIILVTEESEEKVKSLFKGWENVEVRSQRSLVLK